MGRVKAVIYHEYGALPVLAELPEPECPEDGAVISVRATGVCRSDWHAWRGHDPVSLPHVPGHELAGVVAGSDRRAPLAGRRPGDGAVRVRLRPVRLVRVGEAQVCPDQTQPGFTGHGSFAERVAIHAADTNLVRLPESVDFVTAASLGCRFATAFRAVATHGRVGPGDWLAVHGCGGVGLSAVMIGVALGGRVVAVDVTSAALERASSLGAEAVVDASSTPDVAAAVRDLTGGGAHVSVDAFGSPELAVASVRSLRRRGRHVQAGLLLGQSSTPPLPMDLVVSQELEIYGSHGMPARDYPAMLSMIEDGTLRPGDLVGQVIELEDAGAALAAMDRPSATGMTVVRL